MSSAQVHDQLPDRIRQRFFLAAEAEVDRELIAAYEHGQETDNFSTLSVLVRNKRSDRFGIHLTHDIDWLDPRHPYSVLKSAYASINSAYKWLNVSQLSQRDLLLRNIENLLLLEKTWNVDPLFFPGASGKRFNLGRYDIRYGVHDGLFSELIALLKQFGHRIGLQSSYRADAHGQIRIEKDRLSLATDMNIVAHRSHFLRYDPALLYPQLEQAGILYDLSLGQARTVGLNNKFPGKFRPADRSGRVMNVTCVPLILMDNVFFFKPYTAVMQAFEQTLDLLQESNGSACILFHPENMLLKPELRDWYEEILNLCNKRGALQLPALT